MLNLSADFLDQQELSFHMPGLFRTPAVFFGIQYAKAKRASVGRGSGNPKTLMRLGLAGAVITHGLYDFFAFMDWMILFYIFIVIMYVVIFTRLKRLSASDAYFH